MSYVFLKKETAPRILVEAYKLIGTKEIIGKDHNPKILQWAKDLGMEKTYTNDEIPWCGLFMAHAFFGTLFYLILNFFFSHELSLFLTFALAVGVEIYDKYKGGKADIIDIFATILIPIILFIKNQYF